MNYLNYIDTHTHTIIYFKKNFTCLNTFLLPELIKIHHLVLEKSPPSMTRMSPGWCPPVYEEPLPGSRANWRSSSWSEGWVSDQPWLSFPTRLESCYCIGGRVAQEHPGLKDGSQASAQSPAPGCSFLQWGIWSQISRGKRHLREVRGNQVQTSRSPFPAGSHRRA